MKSEASKTRIGITILLLLGAGGAGAGTGPATAGADDILKSLFDTFASFTARLAPATHITFVRGALILIVQTIVCSAILAHRPPGLPRDSLLALQWVAALLVFLALAQLPLAQVHFVPPLEAITFALSLAAIGFLPWRLSALLVPREGQRRVVAGNRSGPFLSQFSSSFVFDRI